jgi:putative transposase
MFLNISTITTQPDVRDQLDDIQVQANYLALREQGFSREDARRHAKLNLADRSLRRLEQQYKEQGVTALIDQRKLAKVPALPLTPEVEDIGLSLWFALPAATDSLLEQRIVARCQQQDLVPPTRRQYKRFLDARTPEEIALRQHKRKELESKFHPVTKIEEVAGRLQLCQVDTQKLDIWVKIWEAEKWVAIRPSLQALLDVGTRVLQGALLLPSSATAWSTLTLLRQAISAKVQTGWPMAGLFKMLQTDNGTEYKNRWVYAACEALRIELCFDPPGYPNNKGKVERFFLTLDQGLLRGLPGHTKAIGTTAPAAHRRLAELLTFDQLNTCLLNWIVDTYHHRLHTSLATTPYECWQQEVTPIIIPARASLNLDLVSGERLHTVSNQGVRWQHTGKTAIFWAPELIPLIGKSVRIFYDPSQPAQLEILDPETGNLLCLAQRMGGSDAVFGLTEVKQERRAAKAQQVKRVKGLRKTGHAHLQALLPAVSHTPATPSRAGDKQVKDAEYEQYLQRRLREEF